MINQENSRNMLLPIHWKEGLPMKNKGLILIVAGIFVILAGIAVYGYVGVGEAGFPTAAEFDSQYDTLKQLGQAGMLAGNSAFFNFFIRYRLVFAIAAAAALVGGAVVILLPGKKKKSA
jgi:hypothetical protein